LDTEEAADVAADAAADVLPDAGADAAVEAAVDAVPHADAAADSAAGLSHADRLMHQQCFEHLGISYTTQLSLLAKTLHTA